MSTRYNTGNPIESTDVRDMSDNAKNFDEFSLSESPSFTDRLGELRMTIRGAIERTGFKPGSGDFTTGFTVMTGERDVSWYDQVSKNWYSYLGVIPDSGYVVLPTTNPVGSSLWKPVTDQTLREDLASSHGASLSGTASGGTVQESLDTISSLIPLSISAHNNDASAHPQLSAFISAEADRAENAANASAINADIFGDVASGLAGTVSGQYFSVVSNISANYLDLYINSAGVAQFKKSYPSTVLVTELVNAKNQLVGDDGFAADGSDGLDTIEVGKGQRKALVIGHHSKELMVFDTVDDVVVLPSSNLERANITGELSLSDVVESDTDNTDDLIVSANAKVIGNAKHNLTFNTENGELVSTFKIVDKSQNKGIVFDNDVPDIITGVPVGYTLSDRLYQGTSTITKVGSRFWLAWRADKNVAGEAPGNFFVIGYSDDNCVTVTESHIVKFTNDNHQMVDPMLWTEPTTGEVWLFWGSFGKAQAQDGVCGCWCSVLENPSATLGFSWSVPYKYRNIGDPRRPVRIAGKWVQCVDMWRSDAAFPPLYPETAGCEFVEFDPLTKTTKNIGHNTPNNPAGGGTFSGFFETEVVQLVNGRLMSTTRGLTGTELTRSFSDDGGKTWTAQEEYTVLGDVSSSRIWLGRTPTGRMLVVYNNDFLRRSLTIRLSEDDGETWPYSVVLEGALTPETVSYPIVAFDGDVIYTTYDYGRGSANEIRVTTVKESEILLGTATPAINIVSGPTI